MTREEASRIIKECKDKGFKYTFYTLNEYHTALGMAIKALEQETCEDMISRQAVLGKAIDYGSNTYLIPVNSVKALPPVTPKPKTGVLDKVRAEILAYDDLIGHNAQVMWCLSIIDKYREEQNYDKGRNS